LPLVVVFTPVPSITPRSPSRFISREHRATGHGHRFTPPLPPDLGDAVGLAVLNPDALDVDGATK